MNESYVIKDNAKVMYHLNANIYPNFQKKHSAILKYSNIVLGIVV